MAIAPEQTGIGIRRHFTTEGVHPYDEVTWELRDARITNFRDGSVAFEQPDVEFPKGWSVNATNIVAQKYFRGPLGAPTRERSLKQVVDRIVDTITAWGTKDGYFVNDTEAGAFSDELKHLLVHQKAAFNSPVWFNIGVAGEPPQASACFILAVDDEMRSILNWYVEEGTIFKGGSGSGINLSNLRSSREGLKGGGTASGPVSFMRGADASAGTIKSGGKTRRAAKMVILNADHPDVEDFIWCKAVEERKARVLRDAGFDMDLDGKDSHSTQYQNANNSVRVTDEFMQAVVDDADWHLRAVKDGRVLQTIKARALFRQIANAAWECSDPCMQFDTTINRWHTASNTGRINASNPCSEYMHLDNSACNLASLNLLKFLNDDDTFDVEGFRAAIEVVFTAQEILVGNADYPTEKIAETSRRFRQLGLGYANLGLCKTKKLVGRGTMTIVNQTVPRALRRLGYGDEQVSEIVAYIDEHKSIIGSPYISAEHLPVFACSMGDLAIHYLGHVKMMAAVQPWISGAISKCVTGETLLATADGLVRMASLHQGELPDTFRDETLAVASLEGTQKTDAFYYGGVRPVRSVVLRSGHRITGTPNHRLLVATAAGLEWRELADIDLGEFVASQYGAELWSVLPARFDEFVASPRYGSQKDVQLPTEMTEELAFLLGAYASEGHTARSNWTITITNSFPAALE